MFICLVHKEDHLTAEPIAHQIHSMAELFKTQTMRYGRSDVESSRSQQISHRVPGLIKASSYDTMNHQAFEDHVFRHVQFYHLRWNAHQRHTPTASANSHCL